MALLADFYISTDKDALAYDENQSLVPPSDKAEYKGFTPLGLSTLWAILNGRDWDVKLMDEFACLMVKDGGAQLIHRAPEAFLMLLASADPETLKRSADAWARTDELDCDPSETEPIVLDLVRLAQRAKATNKNLYLWNCI
jgi:hypothetical protein